MPDSLQSLMVDCHYLLVLDDNGDVYFDYHLADLELEWDGTLFRVWQKQRELRLAVFHDGENWRYGEFRHYGLVTEQAQGEVWILNGQPFLPRIHPNHKAYTASREAVRVDIGSGELEIVASAFVLRPVKS